MVRESILNINKRIADICSGINQDPRRITIVAVAKGRAVEQVKEVIEARISNIGENRVQEAIVKYNAIPDTRYPIPPKWHMVGHLQTNKVKEAVKIFDLIQSVDSIKLATEINVQAAKIDKVQDILIQVNTSGESTKFGLTPEAVLEFIKETSGFKNIRIQGLMTIAPWTDDSQKVRPFFGALRQLRDKINELRLTSSELRVLSMGMSDDFEVAIEEGSNMVRLGRVIFET